MKPVFAGLGCVALALGVIGIFLPLLPTTPFLLLAAFLFARSSERLHTYLITHPYLGAYIRNYHEHTMTRAHKVRTLALMWAGILISAALINKTVTWIILPLIACGVTVHIWRLRGTVD
ncbi:putative secreted or membrane protein [Corynebacterium renale]|uniref:DUF454 domain-containing protein n=1 Tax=Corynebacterium renale TaxID=1724 RepID=A0A2A9DNE7_9CORY|nr:hypothetical protein ATK06_0771 [Corynebacterium renale]SQG63595.1 putative secreted or membrane protein [Corynebacterium renale]SQI22267.1 putative secreted or membrane protein [Corynebacterium renale]STD01108.1 putative secreted or membrane protein [Corynebacterium renale]